MALELDRALFKRLVWLHIVAGLASVLAIVPQFVTGRWFEFGEGFDRLVVAHFGADETSPYVVGAAALMFAVTVGWMLASLVGLLRFQQWGRSGTLISTFLLMALYVVAFGFRPVFSSPFDDVLAFLDSALFGTVMLIAYAKGHGDDWFAAPATVLRIDHA